MYCFLFMMLQQSYSCADFKQGLNESLRVHDVQSISNVRMPVFSNFAQIPKEDTKEGQLNLLAWTR